MEHIDGLIRAGLAAMGLAESTHPDAPARMDEYCRRLLEKNQVMDLTAITQPEDVAALHMLDSAALLTCPGVAWQSAALLDVGTGAGFPGLALKILRPDLTVTLLDSQNKRLDWLAQVAAELGLEGVSLVHGRAEELGKDPSLRESFDIVTARAVAGLPVLAELCLPFAKVGGRFLAMKGPGCEEEAAQAADIVDALGGRLEVIHRYAIPGQDVDHSVAVVRKERPTPSQYPRRWKKLKALGFHRES